MPESPALFGEFLIDRSSHMVMVDGKTVALSPREFDILEALLERPGVPLSRMQLRERLYGERLILGNPAQVHVHNLRAKLGNDVIRTVPGLGYAIAREAHTGPKLHS
jgi:two-component system response regulator QseB